MEKRKRGRSKNFRQTTKINKYCTKSSEESRPRSSDTVCASFQSSVYKGERLDMPKKGYDKLFGDESRPQSSLDHDERNTVFSNVNNINCVLGGETVKELSELCINMSSQSSLQNSCKDVKNNKQLNSARTQSLKLTELVFPDDMNDSVDFKTPKMKTMKVQSKLLFLKEQKSENAKGKDMPVIKHNIGTTITATERDGNLFCEPPTKESSAVPSSSEDKSKYYTTDETSDEKSDGDTPRVDENPQKNSSFCPLCWKRFDKNKINVSHMKTCAAKHNVTTRQLLDAMELQEKQSAEREALGLPGVPTNQTTKKTASRKGSGVGGNNDPNLQLALALSASMREAEEQQMLQEDEVLIEAGLGQEVVAKQMTLLERFGFTSSRPAVLPPLNSRARGKHRLRGFPTLMLRTQEDRERLITEKVAIILMGEEDTTSVEEVQYMSTVHALKSESLQKCQNKECILWTKASASPSKIDKSAFYVESLCEFITPSKVEAGHKLKHLSQIPGRLKTPAKRLHCTAELEDNTPQKPFHIESNLEALHFTSELEDKLPQVPLHIESHLETPQSQTCEISFSEQKLLAEYHSETPQSEAFKIIVPEERLQCSSKTRKSRSSSELTPLKKSTGISGFAEDLVNSWRSILNKSVMSDITIYVKSRFKIPAHELVLYVRCPAVLHDVVKDIDQVSGKVTKSITWSSVSFRAALAFLEYIYCGSINKILSLSEGFGDVQWLVQTYQIVGLEEHLNVVANVRVKVSSQNASPELISQVTQCRKKGSRDHHKDSVISSPLHDDRLYSQSLLTPMYKSPNRKRHSLIHQMSKNHLPKIEVDKSLQKIHKESNVKCSAENEGYRCSSPDPFSESRDNEEVKDGDVSRLLPNTQDNINCLLELINNSSPVQMQSMREFLKNEKTVTKSPVTEECSKSLADIKSNALQVDCSSEELVLSSTKINSDLDKSTENKRNYSNSGSCDDFTNENHNSQCLDKSIGNKRKHSNSDSSDDFSKENHNSQHLYKSTENKRIHSDNGSPNDNGFLNKKLRRDHSNPVRKILLKSFVAATEDTDPPEQKDKEIVIFDLTQSSDGSDHRIMSSSPETHEGKSCTEEDHFCHIISSGSNTSSKFSNKNNKLNISQLEDNSLSKIKEIIKSDMTRKTDSDKSTIENNANNVNATVADISSVSSDKEDFITEEVEDNSGDLGVGYKFDYLDYHYSPCKPYIPELSESSCHSPPSLESQDMNQSWGSVKKTERLSLSQNDSFTYSHNPPKSSLTPKRCLSQGSAEQGSKSNACEVIVLDDSLESEALKVQFQTPIHRKVPRSPKDVTTKPSSSSGHNTPVGSSLESIKHLLEDSYGEQLGNLSLWREEIEPLGSLSTKTVTCSTPKVPTKQGIPAHKTPLQRVKVMESNDVTPLADYSAMTTPLLKKELQKYGIKPLKRKQAKVILRHIYNELHPLVPTDSNVENTSSSPGGFKEPDRDTRVPKSPVKRNLEKQASSSAKKGSRKQTSCPPEQESEGSDSETESSVSSSQSSSRSDFIVTDDVLPDEPGLTQRDLDTSADLPTVVRNFILNDPVLHQKVLLYEPIWLEQFHTDLKAMKYKFKLDQLMHYLDDQCVTFRTTQQQKARARKKGSPRKKSITVTLSKKDGTKKKKSKSKTSSTSSKSNDELSSR